MNKKILLFIFLILFLFAGIIALTQELDISFPSLRNAETGGIEPEPVKPARWFRSNSGGMVLEEIYSRPAALRNEYALAVIYARNDELPDFLVPYYNNEYNLEIRVLYENSVQIRTQWLLRDKTGITRLNAVLMENDEISGYYYNDLYGAAFEEDQYEYYNGIDFLGINGNYNEPNGFLENENENENKIIDINIDNKIGFVEIFNENSILIAEYKFYKDGQKYKTEYTIKENLLISSVFFIWESGTAEGYKKTYTDNYRYNRSLSLRSVEREFHRDMLIKYNQNTINFPVKIMDIVNEDIFINERMNQYPEYFGDVYVYMESKMLFETDDRGRIIRQTLFDDDKEIIWGIQNTWSDNRIISTNKTEGDLELRTEYQYNSAGDRILERNFKNGVLERVVRADGSFEIEELYMNDVIVLRAVWEDGIMISETRVIN